METQNMLLKAGYEMHEMEWLSLFPTKTADKLRSKTEGESTPTKNGSRKRPFPNEHSSNKSKQLRTDGDISECPITQLNKYARERGWGPPKFCSLVIGKRKKRMYTCVAYVNGVERAKTCFSKRECVSEDESKRKTAELCLRNLMKGEHVGGQVKGYFEEAKSDGPPLKTSFGEWSVPGENWEEEDMEDKVQMKSSLGEWNASGEDWVTEWEENEPLNGRVGENSLLNGSVEGKTEPNGESQNSTKVDNVISHVIEDVSIMPEGNGDLEGTPQEDEEMELGHSPNTLSQAPPEEGPDWQIKLLEEMARLRGWDPPVYHVYGVTKRGNISLHLASNRYKAPTNVRRCRVSLNNVEYQPDPFDDWKVNRGQAKKKAALECLKLMLELRPVSRGNQFVEIFKIPIEPTIPQIKTTSESDLTESLSSNPPLPPFAVECARLIIESFSCLNSQDIMDSFGALQAFLKNKKPSCSAAILTSWKWNPNSNEDNPLVQMSDSESSTMKIEMIKNIFQNSETPPEETPFVVEGVEENRKLKVKFESNGVKLTLVPSADNFLQIQTYRLLEYLCTFDNQVLPLLTVAQYWASINSVEIGQVENFGKPLTLQLLIVFFLCHKRIIPTPREIQRRPHTIMIDHVTSVDVGFNPDRTFAKTWAIQEDRENKSAGQDPVEIFQLFSSFLHFCENRLMRNPVIVNVRDCELIDKQIFCDCIWSRKKAGESVAMSTEFRLKEIKEFQAMDSASRKDFVKGHIYVTNPFIATWEFKISSRIKRSFKAIRITGNRLSKLLKDYRANSEGKMTPTNEEGSLLALNLKEMLKVDCVYPIAGTSSNGDIM